jgi:hypothetical protein
LTITVTTITITVTITMTITIVITIAVTVAGLVGESRRWRQCLTITRTTVTAL